MYYLCATPDGFDVIELDSRRKVVKIFMSKTCCGIMELHIIDIGDIRAALPALVSFIVKQLPHYKIVYHCPEDEARGEAMASLVGDHENFQVKELTTWRNHNSGNVVTTWMIYPVIKDE